MLTKLQIKQGYNKLVMVPLLRMRKRSRLKDKNVSIICCNCIGGCISHDLGLRFLSPTINLFFSAEDYITFAEKLEYYLSLEMTEFSGGDTGTYPIGVLGKDEKERIKIHFLHYSDFATAKEKWVERAQRINWDNIFLIFTDQNGCNQELVERFAKLPYRKIMFTSTRDYNEDFCVFLDSKKIPTEDGRSTVDDACVFHGISGRRNYEYEIDIVDYLNKKG